MLVGACDTSRMAPEMRSKRNMSIVGTHKGREYPGSIWPGTRLFADDSNTTALPSALINGALLSSEPEVVALAGTCDTNVTRPVARV